MNHKFTKIRRVLQSTTKEEPTEIRQDIDIMSSPSRDSAKTARKGKRRSLIGRVFRRLFCLGKKKKEADRDPGEIIAIPPETTNGEDIVPTSEKATEATRGTEYVYASEINIGPTSGTDSAHQQAAEELEFTTSEPDQKSELQATNATDIVPASEKETEATSGTEHVHASKINIGATSGTDSAHQQATEELEFTTSEPDQKSEILSTNVTDIVETAPNPGGRSESTTATESDTSSDDKEFTRVLETLAELKDGKETSSSTETLSIPESGIEITATTNNESDSEDTTQSTDTTTTDESETSLTSKSTGSSDSIYFSAEEPKSTPFIDDTSLTSKSTGSSDSIYFSAEEPKSTPFIDDVDAPTGELEIRISTETIPESGIEITATTNNESDSEDTTQSTDTTTTDESETSLTSKSTGSSDSIYFSAEEPKSTPFIDDVDEPTGELEIRIPTETIPERRIEITATLDNESESEDTIQLTKATDIVETVPTSKDGMESTVVENVAELKGGMDIRIPSEIASIPESRTEITATTDIVSASELKTEVISSTDNALDHAVLPRKESVPPLTTQEEPAEDKLHPSGGPQHAQQNATPAGKHQSFCSKISAFLCTWGRNASSGGTNEIQSDVPVPLTVKSFKYHKRLGEGRFGKVFVTSHPATDQLLAIKKVKKNFSAREKLLAERTIQEMVGRSRFFPELYATFQTKEYLFYVMEYVKGVTLAQFKYKRSHLDHDSIRFIAAEILCAIQDLHCRGIVHCDLHANNILIDSTGHVKIIDFGLSRIKEEPYNPDTTIITEYGEDKKPWVDYLSEYHRFRQMLMYLIFDVTHTKDKDPELLDLLVECRRVRRNLRQHPFFAGIDWKELEAGNVTPPYVMEPNPEINRSKEIRVNGTRFMKHRGPNPTKEVPGFDFVSDRWRERCSRESA